MRLADYFANISIEMVFMKSVNSNAKEPQKVLLNLRSSNKHAALKILFITRGQIEDSSTKQQTQNDSSNME